MIEAIIAIITAVFLALIAIIIRQASRIATLEFSLKNENHNLDDIRSKMKITQEEHDKTISCIKNKYEGELASLNDEIDRLNEIINHNNNPINFDSEW